MFYLRLAFTNLKSNRKTYIPYLLTCILTVLMFYIMFAIGENAGLDEMEGAEDLKTILHYAALITGLFAAIFLFYTNSFLVKQRKKEFGLYQVLGMDKANLAKMLACESLVTAGASLGIGLLLGILLGKLMFLILLKILHFSVPITFAVEPDALLCTMILFPVIFLVLFCWNLLQIWKTDPIGLLHGSSQGEKEPKTKWVLTLIGIVTMGSGYYIALTTESPLNAIEKFFFAVILVIIGTYTLFIAGSIALLKGLKKNKYFYYQSRHFISVSGMLYRMKQNAAGLSSICIMSTIVLVLVSVTVSLYGGIENIIETRFPNEIHVEVYDAGIEHLEQIETILEEELRAAEVKETNRIAYRSSWFGAVLEGEHLILGDEDIGISENVSNENLYSEDQYRMLYLIPLSDYNEMEHRQETLQENEVLVYMPADNLEGSELILGNEAYKVKETLKTMKIETRDTGYVVPHVYVILPDTNVMEQFMTRYLDEENRQMIYSLYFDLEGEEAACKQVVGVLQDRINATGIAVMENRDASRKQGYLLYGGFLFLGVFVGALFLMGTILIIYYKQISEGYEDRSRYQIMQQVGMDRREVKQSIQSQVLQVFFLPLLTAILHVAVAFKPISKLLAALHLVNVRLEIICTCCTILVFAVFYAIVYGLTSREYYKIVK